MADAPDGLDVAVLAALRPGSLRERLRARLVGGWTVLQVYERLPDPARLAADGEAPDTPAATRRGIDRVHRCLLALVEAGRVRRRRQTYVLSLNTKGDRGMLVDLYRLA